MREIQSGYNLLDEEWIPVLWNDGRNGNVGVRQALLDAHRIRAIACTNPMDRVAILRYLLALLYWCRGNPGPEQRRMGGPFPGEWFSRLADNHELFNLLGDGDRFYQDADAVRRRPITDLFQEIPTANNFAHFKHVADFREGLCPACCAMGLLRLPLYSTSGLGGLRAGINGTPPIYVTRLGPTMADTLRANWRAADSLGDPSWVRPLYTLPETGAIPLLVGMTILSRRVWLNTDSVTTGNCAGCGRTGATLLHHCEYQPAGDLKTDGWTDHHVVYSAASPRKASAARNPMTAGRFTSDWPWTDLCGRILADAPIPTERGATLLAVGFATNQALGVDVWERTVDLADITEEFAEEASSMLAAWDSAGHALGNRVAHSRMLGKSTISAARPHVEHAVSTRTGTLFAPGAAAWAEAADEYRSVLNAVAGSLYPDATVSASRGRARVRSSVPDLQQTERVIDDSDVFEGGDE